MAHQERWHSRLTFILAAAGSAVGLGNIWKFPYITGMNGGGAFVLFYLACIAFVALPLLMCEMYIGAQGQAGAVRAFDNIHRPHTPYRWLGVLALVAVFLILSFYSVIGGQILDFLQMTLRGQLTALDQTAIMQLSERLQASPTRQIGGLAVFMLLNACVIAGGFKNGLERANSWLMPALVAVLTLLFVRVLFLPGSTQALAFLFRPNTDQFTSSGVLDAIGHSFFTLNVAAAVHITYSSHLSSTQSLGRSALIVAVFDTIIAMMFGVVIFAITFSFDVAPNSGPTLLFQTLPLLFAQIPGGQIIGTLFFVLVAFAALTSSLAMLEALVCHMTETNPNSRTRVSFALALAAFVAGIATALSPNVLASYTLWGHTPFALIDRLTANFCLPAGGIGMALFVGWVVGPKAVAVLLGARWADGWLAPCFLWTIRLIAPAAVAVIWLQGLFA
ncbi:MAG: sodium-dependent transporter [Myxococcota bacterium]